MSHSSVFMTQLIRGGLDSVINLIFRLFFSKRRPAITLEDPNIKYALRLIDKEVRWNESLNAAGAFRGSFETVCSADR